MNVKWLERLIGFASNTGMVASKPHGNYAKMECGQVSRTPNTIITTSPQKENPARNISGLCGNTSAEPEPEADTSKSFSPRKDLIQRYREGLRAMIRADQANDRAGYKAAVDQTKPIEKLLTREEMDYHLRGDPT